MSILADLKRYWRFATRLHRSSAIGFLSSKRGRSSAGSAAGIYIMIMLNIESDDYGVIETNP
ncbi:MAG TPA: hypothetical protein VGL11_21570 [Candidatus Binatia bacterium]|jgi:hypothetical protein